MTAGVPGSAELELLVTRVMPFGKHKGTFILKNAVPNAMGINGH